MLLLGLVHGLFKGIEYLINLIGEHADNPYNIMIFLIGLPTFFYGFGWFFLVDEIAKRVGLIKPLQPGDKRDETEVEEEGKRLIG